MGLSLKGIGNIEGVGKVHRTRLDKSLEKVEIDVFLLVVKRSFAKREEFGRNNFVHHMSLHSPHRLCLCNDDDILVWAAISSYSQLVA